MLCDMYLYSSSRASHLYLSICAYPSLSPSPIHPARTSQPAPGPTSSPGPPRISIEVCQIFIMPGSRILRVTQRDRARQHETKKAGIEAMQAPFFEVMLARAFEYSDASLRAFRGESGDIQREGAPRSRGGLTGTARLWRSPCCCGVCCYCRS